MFDIELFAVGDQVYLNEINFRNSGNTWASVRYGINSPAIWAKDFEGKTLSYSNCRKSMSYMDETADIHHVLSRKISVIHWLSDVLRTRAFNKFWIRDLKGTFAFYFHTLRWIVNH